LAKKKPWFVEASPRLGAAFLQFHTTVTNNHSLDDKTMELIKIAASSVLRCPHCTDLHIEKALEVGATRQEIADTLLIASLQGAGTQLFWNKKAFEGYLAE
jgi:AhpD family alkylhydroperoxidase